MDNTSYDTASTLAREVKTQQNQLTGIIRELIDCINRLQNNNEDAAQIARDAATNAENNCEDLLNRITEILRGSPTSQEVAGIINQAQNIIDRCNPGSGSASGSGSGSASGNLFSSIGLGQMFNSNESSSTTPTASASASAPPPPASTPASGDTNNIPSLYELNEPRTSGTASAPAASAPASMSMNRTTGGGMIYQEKPGYGGYKYGRRHRVTKKINTTNNSKNKNSKTKTKKTPAKIKKTPGKKTPRRKTPVKKNFKRS